ncbi:MAG: polysaccharide biosynthesis C-terminal domain-containing protein [Ktedonobacterales bacterium]
MTTDARTRAGHKAVVVSTAGSAAVAVGGELINGVLRYTAVIVMTHMVAQSAYGVFVVILAAVTFVSFATKLGMDDVLLRFLPRYRAHRERALAAGLLRFTIWIPAIIGTVCAALFYLLSPLIAHHIYHNAAYTLPLREAALLIPLIAVQNVLTNGLRALKAIKWQVGVGKVLEPGIILVLVLVFYLFGMHLESLTLANICAVAISAIFAWFLLRRGTRELVHETAPAYEPAVWLRLASAMIFNVLAFAWLQSTDVLFLGAFARSGEVGLYAIADRVSYLVVMPLLALNVIFAPMTAEYHARGEHKQLANMFALVTRWSFSLSWPIFLCCVVFHDAILGVFGKQYTGASAALIVLAFANLISSGAGSVNSILTMTGRVRVIWFNMVGRVVVNLVLVVTLIPRFGVIGTAVAATLTVVLFNIVGLVEIWWIMQIHPYRWDMLKPIIAGAPAVIVGALLLRVTHVGYGKLAIVGVLGLGLAFMIVYVLALGLMRLGEEDVMVFEAVRGRLFKRSAA